MVIYIGIGQANYCTSRFCTVFLIIGRLDHHQSPPQLGLPLALVMRVPATDPVMEMTPGMFRVAQLDVSSCW